MQESDINHCENHDAMTSLCAIPVLFWRWALGLEEMADTKTQAVIHYRGGREERGGEGEVVVLLGQEFFSCTPSGVNMW